MTLWWWLTKWSDSFIGMAVMAGVAWLATAIGLFLAGSAGWLRDRRRRWVWLGSLVLISWPLSVVLGGVIGFGPVFDLLFRPVIYLAELAGWPSMAVPLAGSTLILGLGLLVAGLILAGKHRRLWIELGVMGGAGVGGLVVFWGLLFGSLWLLPGCFEQVTTWHRFNGHLQDVCYRADMSQCPRDVSQLVAFDPAAWESLKRCGEVEYWWSEELQLYAFTVKWWGTNYYTIGHLWFAQGYDAYFVRPTTSDQKKYPPTIPGPWTH